LAKTTHTVATTAARMTRLEIAPRTVGEKLASCCGSLISYFQRRLSTTLCVR